MNVKTYDIQGKEKGAIKLNDRVFNIEPNKSAIYYALKVELSNERQGTSSTKGRSEVRGSGKKPWRQKGTGRARAGSRRSPIWTGGGVAFGPKPRNYRVRLPKKIKRLSIQSILSLKIKKDMVKIVEDFSVETGKTREFHNIAIKLVDEERRKRVLFIDDGKETLNKRAERNIPWVKYCDPELLNTKDLFYSTQLLITERSVKLLNKKYS